MKRDINTTGAAARALGARNPVTFDCVHSLEESIQRLAAITDPWTLRDQLKERRPSMREQLSLPMAPMPNRPKGHVDGKTVQLDWGRVRFEGRWDSHLGAPTLQGEMVPHGIARTVVPTVVMVTGTAISVAMGPGLYWMAGIMVAIVLVAMPLFVAWLGSERVASEIELERLIGSAIADPDKYAARWRRWRDE